jgi:hypothetical protein
MRDSWTSEDVKELRVRLRKLDRKNRESGKGPDGQGEKFYEQVRAWVTGEGGDGRGSGEQIFGKLVIILMRVGNSTDLRQTPICHSAWANSDMSLSLMKLLSH